MPRVSAYLQSAPRRIQRELNRLIGKRVEVELTNGKIYVGVLREIEYPSLNMMLVDAERRDSDETQGARIPLLFINGSVVAEVRAEEVSVFDAREFADYLAKRLGLRADAVRVVPEANIVLVYNSIRVTEHGVEGSGSMAAKISYILKEYLDRKKRGEPAA